MAKATLRRAQRNASGRDDPTSDGKAPGERRLVCQRDLFGAVIGWKHAYTPSGIDITIQTTDKVDISSDTIQDHHLLMSRNQALILAKYLLDATGQTLPPAPPRSWLARWLS